MSVEVPAATSRSWASDPVVHGLGIYALAMYGVTYYAIGAAAPVMARDLGTTTSAIFAVLGAALIGSAIAAPRIGRLVDRIGAGPVLLWGGAARAASVAAMAAAPDIWSFAVALVAVQFLSQLTEYDAVFAAAVQARGEEARASVSLITLWGGLASTAFWPLTALALQSTSWRVMLAGYALLLLALSALVASAVIQQSRAPLGAAGSSPSVAGRSAQVGVADGGVAASQRAFLPLAIAFSLAGVAMGLPVILPPVLDGLGLGAGAVVAGLLFGPSQTAARLLELVVGRRFAPLAVAVAATALLPIALVVLVAGGANLASAIVFAVLFGAANGVGSIVRGTVVLQVFGTAGYATWLGRIARVRLVVAAVTPFVLAVLLERFGAVAAIALCIVCGSLATLAFAYAWRRFA